MPYETVDDVPSDFQGTRALGRWMKTVAEAKVLGIVVASKRFRTDEKVLDLAAYLETLCIDIAMEKVFDED